MNTYLISTRAKRLLLAGAGLASSFALLPTASAELIAYEPFDYGTSGGILGPNDLTGEAGGEGWTGGWITSDTGSLTNKSPIQEGSLHYEDEQGNWLAVQGNHVRVSGQTKDDPGTSSTNVRRNLPALLDNSAGNVYYISYIGQRLGEPVDMEHEFWLNDEDPPELDYPYGTNPYPRNAGLRLLGNETGNDAVGLIGRRSGRPTNVWAVSGDALAGDTEVESETPFTEQAFVVVRIEYTDEGTADNGDPLVGTKVALWVNPADLNVEDPEAAYEKTADDGGNPVQWNIYGIGIEAGGVDYEVAADFVKRAAGDIIVDEIRVGTTWDDVTPVDPEGGNGGGGGDDEPIDDALAFFELDADVDEDFWLDTAGLRWVYAGDYPWVYSYSELGWLYSYETSATFSEGSWFWDHNRTNWVYTASGDYPWLWIHTEGWVDASPSGEE